MNKNLEAWKAINRIFDNELPVTPPDFEEEMIQLIRKRVTQLMHADMGLLLSHLYRLDVEEKKVEAVLFQEEHSGSVEYNLAKLIWDRQKMRIQTKDAYKAFNPDDIPEDYKW